MAKPNALAVLDVGKTNKKTVFFDEELHVLAVEKQAFPEIERDGLLVEQPEAVFDWFLECLRRGSENWNIRALSVATHGVAVVCLDEQGALTVPPLSYTNVAEAGFADAFFDDFGSREALQRRTATAEIGSLVNSAKLLRFMQSRFPEAFSETTRVLFYPQYFVQRLTGAFRVEPTMLGCHTYLYDPAAKGYSSVARKLGAAALLPPTISRSWERAGTVRPETAARCGLREDCVVATGVHDSNASLLPYLISETGPFVLNSTGTWCVAMRPSDSIEITADEIGKAVFYNFDVFERPVKTSLFMGGNEYDAFLNVLQRLHGRSDAPPFDADIHRRAAQSGCFILPAVAAGPGIFPDKKACVVEKDAMIPFEAVRDGAAVPECFRDYDFAAALLNLSLAVQSSVALRYAGFEPGDTVYVEGGFARNEAYLRLLAGLLPGGSCATSTMEEATASGAAILALACLRDTPPDRLNLRPLVRRTAVADAPAVAVDAYARRWLKALDRHS